jgi:phospholipid/cholesterol/gamma-HCH transport system substrate-binding protein
MKTTTVSEIKVGIFVVIILILFGVAVFAIGSHQKLFQSQYTLRASFSDIQGLMVGAPVRLAGLTVGRVDAIYIPPELQNKTITVVLKISKGLQERIREDSVASIQTMGLLGDKYVEISMGSPPGKVLPDGGRIASSEPIDLFEYATKLEETINVVNSILVDVKEISGQIRTGKGLLHAILYDPEGGKVVDNLASTAKSINSIVDKVDRGEGTLGALVNDPTVYDDLKVILGGAKHSTIIKGLIRYTIKKKKKEAEGEKPAK